MASYLQGVTDYIPQIQPWSPDFNFYQNTLGRKQQQYDVGWEQTNSVYNSILNAPMMREQNIARRDDFFKNIEHQLQQMASIDLSLPQNVDAAKQVFKPFYEDDNIVKDIGFTKKYQDELQRAEYFRNCQDKECKGQYWQGGVRALQYQAQDFIDASDSDALRTRAPQYTPYVNMMEKATVAAKEAGLSVTFDTKQGGYIVSTTNGPALQMPLMNFFMSRFGDDPSLGEYYNTRAYLLTKENPDQANQMFQMAMSNPGNSPEQMESSVKNNHLTNTYEESKKVIQSKENRESNRFITLTKRKNLMKKDLEKNPAVAGSERANAFVSLVEDSKRQEKVVGTLTDMGSEIVGVDDGIAKDGLVANETQMRGVIANALKLQDMFGAATALSYKDYKRTMKADQFALESTRQSNRESLARLKQGFTQQNKATDFIYKKALAKNAADLKSGKIDRLGNGSMYKKVNTLNDVFGGTLDRGPVAEGQPVDMADQLALNMIYGASDPYSGMSVHGGLVEKLIQQGNIEGANAVAGSSNRGGQLQENVNKWAPQYGTPAGIDRANIEIKTDDSGDATEAAATNMLTEGLQESTQTAETTENMRGAFDKVISNVQGTMEVGNQIVDEFETENNGVLLNSYLSMAADAGDHNSVDAQFELLNLGRVLRLNMAKMSEKLGGDILNDFTAYSAASEEKANDLPVLDEAQWTAITTMPDGLDNMDNMDAPNYYRQLANAGSNKIIQLAGGDKSVYEFLETESGSFVEDPDSGKWLDRSSVNLIDDNTYSIINNLIHDEYTSGTKNPELTEEMRSQADQYEVYNNNSTFERHVGSGTEIGRIQAYNTRPDVANRKSFRGLIKAANEKTTNVWNSSIKNAQQTLAENLALADEDSDIGNLIRNIAIDNIIVPGEEGGLDRIAKNYEMVNAIAEAIPTLREQTGPASVIPLLEGRYVSSITDFSNDFAADGPLSNSAILNLLSVSDYSTNEGANEFGDWFASTKPDYSTSAHKWVNSIAGFKFDEDRKLSPANRKYTSVKDAAIDVLKEEFPFQSSSYTETNSNIFGISPEDLGISGDVFTVERTKLKPKPNSIANLKGDVHEPSRNFFQWLGKYGDVVNSDYGSATRNQEGGLIFKPTGTNLTGGGEDTAKVWNIRPDNKYLNQYLGAEKQDDYGDASTFQLGAAMIDSRYRNLFEKNHDAVGRVYKEYLTNLSEQKSAIGGQFLGEDGAPTGVGSMAAPTTMLRNIDMRRQGDPNFVNAYQIIQEAASKGNFGTGVEWDNEAIGPITERSKQAITSLFNDLSLEASDFSKGKSPQFNLEVHPVAGDYNRARYKLTFTDPNWLKSKGYNKVSGGEGETIENTRVPMDIQWMVEKPSEEIAKNALPGVFDQLLGTMKIGESWTDNSLSDKYGNITYTRNGGNEYQASMTLNVFNPAIGKEQEINIPGPALYYNNADMMLQHTVMVEKLMQTKAFSDDTKNKWNMINGVQPQEFLQELAEQYGVSVDQLLR